MTAKRDIPLPASPPPAGEAPPRPAGPGRPKDLGKRAAILEAAKRMFVAHGYAGVSMDQIAADAGVSKLTVYSHFGDKESLFAAAVASHCDQGLPTALFDPQGGEQPLRERLLDIARAFFAMITAPEALAGHRMLCSPQLAGTPLSAAFWDAGPRRCHDSFAQLLQRRIDAGELRIEDVHRASTQFFALLKGEPYLQLIYGCADTPGDVEAHLQACVDLFLRAFDAQGR